jgi:hypothetical protein
MKRKDGGGPHEEEGGQSKYWNGFCGGLTAPRLGSKILTRSHPSLATATNGRTQARGSTRKALTSIPSQRRGLIAARAGKPWGWSLIKPQPRGL